MFITAAAVPLKAQQPSLLQIADREKKMAAVQLNMQQTSVAPGNFKVHYYECVWQVDPAVYYITGKVTAHFNITQSTNSIVFDLSHQLVVDSVLVRGWPAGFLQSPNESLNITLPATYAAGDTGSTVIYYHGKPPADNAAFVQQLHNGVPVIWTLSEPYGAKDWWPCRNGLDDKADSIDVYIVHPAQYRATSNGLLQSETTVGNTTTAFYKHRYPIASYLVALAVTNYNVFTQSIQLGNTTLPFKMYVYPESQANFQQYTYLLFNAMQVFYTYLGSYPFDKEQYGQTQFGYGGGMEHQTNSFVTSPNANLTSHELAHQWFGDKVTCGSWHDIWLNEGFAEYLADFLYTGKSDSGYYQAYINYDLSVATSKPNGSVWVDDTTSSDRIFDARLTYAKGAYLLRMLRWTLGDSAFFNGLRNYLNDPKLQYSFARVSDLKQHLEETSHTDLTYFFNQWYYGQGFPSFKVSWQQNLNNYTTVNISQATSDQSVSFFKVPLALTFKGGTQSKTFIINDSINTLQTTLDIGFAADTVLIDPDRQLLSKSNTSTKLPLTTTALNDVTVYPNPFKDKLLISIKNPGQQQWQVMMYNTIGQKILQQTFNITGADALLQAALPLYLPAGLYFIKIDAGDVHIVKKAVK